MVIYGCSIIPVQETAQKPFEDQEIRLLHVYLRKAKIYKIKDDLLNALNYYNLAYTVDPQNKEAERNIVHLEKKLPALAEKHFESGQELYNKGQYKDARREYLLTLRLWSEHSKALRMLSKYERVQAKREIEHKIEQGDSLSVIADLYYGDFRQFPRIAEYNKIYDASKIKVGQIIKIPEIEGLPFLIHKRDEPIKPMSRPEVKNLEEQKAEPDKVEEKKPISITLKEEKPEPDNIKETMEENKEIEPSREAAPVIEKETQEIESGTKEKEGEEKKEEKMGEKEVGVEEEEIEEGQNENLEGESDVLAMDLNHGINLFNRGEYQKAIVEFNKLVDVNSENKMAQDYLYKSHFQYAMILFAKQDYLSAKREFESSLQYKSDCEKCREYIIKSEEAYKEFHYVKGISFFKDEKLSEALKEWEQVWNIDPEYKGIEQNINKAETLLKRLEEIRKSQQQNPPSH